MTCRVLWAALAVAVLGQAAAAQEVVSAPGAVLRALDRVTGQTTDLVLKIGETKAYAELAVRVSDCRYPAGDPNANAYAEVTIGDVPRNIVLFDGWMVATSPALSALDHPRYDIWVLRCQTE